MSHRVIHTVHKAVHCLRRVEILGATDGSLGAMTMMDNPTWTLTDRLRKARLLAGLEQSDLAEMLRVSRNSISNYENGKTEPSATTFVRWAAATGVTLEWLAEGIRVNDKTPAEAGVLEDVRPKGFEPPTFWLGVDATHERGASSVTELSNGVAGLGLLLVLALRAVRSSTDTES